MQNPPRVVVTVLNIEDVMAAYEGGAEGADWKISVEFPEALGVPFVRTLLQDVLETLPEEDDDAS